jgi:AAA15 family ATPase/GTPase
MIKIKKVTFKNHPVLQNLSLDFCDNSGKPVDTVIFAGENGTGKSNIISAMYEVVRNGVPSSEFVFSADIEFKIDTEIITLKYKKMSAGSSDRTFFNSMGVQGINPELTNNLFGIFSDVDINFHSAPVNSVTSLSLDSSKQSQHSDTDLPNKINQLLIDIQALDDAELSNQYRSAKSNSQDTNRIIPVERMQRFKRAFNMMFENMNYDRVDNIRGHKSIIFKKKGMDIPIENLSSGEKQIVYRGCFLLKDVNALNGAFVFIDEPEISLHPSWQKKIMEYYKGIFTDDLGNQTSQIFAVTHSPFIIHNENRKNDKVIVIERHSDGTVCVRDKPEYYKCDSLEAVKDAFSINNFSSTRSSVYLEGRTDEKYFRRAAEVFGYTNLPFQFKWIGYMDDKGQEANTGKDALNKAVQFLISQNLYVKNICLFDCDTQRSETAKNNVYTRVIPTYTNTKKMKRGIENALVLDTIDVTPYYSLRVEEGFYGDDKTIQDFKKMEFCDYICSLDIENLKVVFRNLKTVIDILCSI